MDENTSQFNKDFTENYNEDSDKGYSLVVEGLVQGLGLTNSAKSH